MRKIPKPDSISSQPAMDTEVGLTIQFIIDEIRKTGARVSKARAKEMNPKVDMEKLLMVVESHGKVGYNKKDELFELKSAYNIKNRNELWRELIQTREGILENDELWDCYPACKADIDIFKKMDAIISLDSNDKKTKVLFGINKDDPVYEEYKKVDKESLQAVREIWENEIKNVGEAEMREILEKEGIEVKRKAIIMRKSNKTAGKEDKKKTKHRKVRENLLGKTEDKDEEEEKE